ncbi:YdcF family protein [Desulfomicrobium sp. ZS1]|uniref:YdcF family protein n=1 Tax=Desulfomicrobium sp. ZS1 TaxID=2952228 RepID=UPI0020B3E30A|nr:YdcF family protein [Desulfomicrobium sp. ZS1]UTF50721.1 YdcF family protein [Desulfomicrobium sp. ZS1]
MRTSDDLRKRRPSSLFILTSILVVAVAAVLLLSVALESVLVVSKPLPKADVMVVMAGGRDVRLPPVAALYKEGVAQRVLLTNDGIFAGWSTKYDRNLYLVEWAREDLLEMGIPEGAIVLLRYTASGTIHDALNTLDYVRAHPEIRSLLVVTTDYHTRRTLWTFELVFEGEGTQIGVSPVPDLSQSWWRRAQVAYLEFLKYVYYRLRY